MISELETKGHMRFRFGRRDQLVLYKQKGETLTHVYLKAATYALFFREVEGLAVDPKLRYKFPADLAALDPAGDPRFWVIVEDVSLPRLEWTLRHVPASEVVLVTEGGDLERLVAQIRREIHYRYTHRRLLVYHFLQPVEDWLDPDGVEVPDGAYDIFHF